MPISEQYEIVVADDDTDDQYLIREAIQQSGIKHNVTAVYNGLQLLDLLRCKGIYKDAEPRRPDLIILDLNMPVLEGSAALENIKSDQSLKDIPVYILSTSTHSVDIEKCKNLGANQFYPKPYQFGKLKAIIEDMINTLP